MRAVVLFRRVAAAVAVAIVAAAFDGAAQAGIRITGVDPAAAPHGAEVELRGSGFGGSRARVWVGGVSAQVLSATGNRVVFTVPDAAPVGETFVKAAGPGKKKAIAPFTVIEPDGVTVILDTARAVSATIGRDGGSLESQGVQLEIPAGALSEPVLITLTPLLGLHGSPLDGSFIGGAKLAPEGLVFLRPARLTVPLPTTGVAAHDVLGFGSAGDGSDLHLRPRLVEVGVITLELWHFSTAGASSGGSAASAAMQSRQPSAAEQQALQRIAVAQQACDAELAQGIAGGPACANVRPESVRALFDWYTNAVRPGLDQADTALSPQAEAALAEWLAWKAEVELVFLNDPPPQCGTLQSECDSAHVLATTAVAAHVQRRLNNCTGTSLAAQLRDVARMADFAGAGAIVLPSPLPDPTGGALLHACAHLKIAVVEFPAIAALSYANTLRGRVTVDVFSGPDRTDVPFTLTVGGAPVGTAADGSFQTTVTTTSSPLDVTIEAEATDASLQNTAFTAVEQLTRPARERLQLLAQGPTSVPLGGTVSLLVRVAGDGMTGNVPLTVGGLGSVSPSPVVTDSQGEATAVYTAPSAAANPNAQVIATLTDGTTASVPITITGNVTVSLSPTSATLAPGGSQNFSATVNGSFLGVTWSATGGSITGTGGTTARYDAGATAGTFTVTATSIDDPSVSATASVTIQAPSGGQVSVLSRASSVSAFCNAEHMTVSDCRTPDPFTTALGPFSDSATEAVTGTIEQPSEWPGFVEQASANASQSSDVHVDVLFPLQLDFSGTASATATAGAGVSAGGGVARAGASAGGRSDYIVEFEVSGGELAFTVFGTASLSGSGCVVVVLDRLSASGVEFEVDFCAGEPAQSLNDTGTLAPGRYRFEVGMSAGATWQADYVDGVLVSDGIAAGSTTVNLNLVLN
jgi:hypothetical protein